MTTSFHAITDIGRVRKFNEDNFTVVVDQEFYMVADGMGGQAAGEIASAIAVKRASEFITSSADPDFSEWPDSLKGDEPTAFRRLRVALGQANNAIFAEAENDLAKNGMGTTAVCALIEDNTLQVANIGDSRAYIFRENGIEQLTSDHTWVNQQLAGGLLTEEQARNHPYRNIITRALGVGKELEIDLSSHDLKNDDVVVFCSDGLTGMISDEEICNIITLGEFDMELTSKTLIRRANDNGGRDNITVILVHFTTQD